MLSKMRSKIMCFLEPPFGRVLGEFWEAKTLDFRTFCDVFWQSFFKRVSKRRKISPNRPKTRRRRIVGAGFRWSPSSWGEKKRRVARSVLRYQDLDAEHSAKIL